MLQRPGIAIAPSPPSLSSERGGGGRKSKWDTGNFGLTSTNGFNLEGDVLRFKVRESRVGSL